MKRRDLLRHLEMHGCVFEREGAEHTVYVNPFKRKVTAIPRHRELDHRLCRRICKDLDIPRIE